MKYLINFFLLCFVWVFSYQDVFAQKITTDKNIYDETDTITITFSYGDKKDLGAFVVVIPIEGKCGSGRFYSNAYNQVTGNKVISDHRFSPGEYEADLWYDPANSRRIIARTTFKILNSADKADQDCGENGGGGMPE